MSSGPVMWPAFASCRISISSLIFSVMLISSDANMVCLIGRSLIAPVGHAGTWLSALSVQSNALRGRIDRRSGCLHRLWGRVPAWAAALRRQCRKILIAALQRLPFGASGILEVHEEERRPEQNGAGNAGGDVLTTLVAFLLGEISLVHTVAL